MTKQQTLERVTLGAAGRLKPGQRIVQRGKQGSVKRGADFLTLDCLRHVEHAAQRQKAVGARRSDAELLLQPLRQAGDILQEEFVDDRLRLQRSGLADGQRRLEIAARETFLHGLPQRRLQTLEARRQPQPELDAFAVDGLDLPGDRDAVVIGNGSRETGHALQSHDLCMSPACLVCRNSQGKTGSRLFLELLCQPLLTVALFCRAPVSARLSRPDETLGKTYCAVVVAGAAPPSAAAFAASSACFFWTARQRATFSLCSSRVAAKTWPPVPSATK